MKVVAVTACTTGIAHTYMAAEQLEKTAKELGHQIKVDRGLPLTDLHRDPLTHRLGGARDPITDGADRPCRATAECIHPGDLPGRDAGDLLDNAVGNGGVALGGLQIGGSGRLAGAELV